MSSSAHHANLMRMQAMLAAGLLGKPRLATCTDYDPDAYAAKAMIQPDERETGWLPVMTIWAGNGYGVYCGPSPGDQVIVIPQENDAEAGFIIGSLFSDEDKPLSVPAGEFWVVHKSGSKLQFKAGGNVFLSAQAALTMEAPTYNVQGPGGASCTFNIKATISHTGNQTSSGTITGTTDVVGGGKHLKTHTHNDPQGGTTGGPT